VWLTFAVFKLYSDLSKLLWQRESPSIKHALIFKPKILERFAAGIRKYGNAVHDVCVF
jgi:hypothetical protein